MARDLKPECHILAVDDDFEKEEVEEQEDKELKIVSLMVKSLQEDCDLENSDCENAFLCGGDFESVTSNVICDGKVNDGRSDEEN